MSFLSSAEAIKTQKPCDTRRQVADRFLNRPLLSFFCCLRTLPSSSCRKVRVNTNKAMGGRNWRFGLEQSSVGVICEEIHKFFGSMS